MRMRAPPPVCWPPVETTTPGARDWSTSARFDTGAVAVTSTPADFTVTQGEDKLATYRFNTGTAEHHFCSICGIYTHHKRRSNPNQLGVNVACLEGVSPFDFREVKVHDGQRHLADNAEHRTYTAGVLRFEPAEG